MKIEAGKYYKTRDGRKVGPMNVPPKNTTWSSIVKSDAIVEGVNRGWCDGGLYRTYNGEHSLDLIAKWTDDQIGTLPELDVKPGDVVENISHERYKGLQWTCYDKHPNGYSDQPCAVYSKDGQSGYIYVHNRDEYKFRLISRAKPSIDLTAIREPFGLLDKATQDAMIAHGGPYEYFWGDAWFDTFTCDNVPEYAHRVKPGPKRETVTKDMYLTQDGAIRRDEWGNNCTITYDTIDGVIDMATYRVVAK